MFVNLTPHQIKIHSSNGSVQAVEPSGKSLRVSSNSQLVSISENVEFYSVEFGQLEIVNNSDKSVIPGLPAASGDMFIVSGQCLEAIKQKHPERRDFAAPGELVRDSNGQPVGCKGLRVNT